MKEYTSDKLRNVSIVSHGGAGKTSLTEALLYKAGAITRLGRVDDGTATTDFEPEEIKRKVTISTALAPCEWRDHKINFLDTPGYADFVAEVKSSLYAADSVMVVLCAASGVEVETEKVWQYAQDMGLPRIAFINKMDRENADFYGVVEGMKEKLGKNIVPIVMPIGAEADFVGLIDLVNMKAYKADGNDCNEIPIPEDMSEAVEEAHTSLIEAIAETDDELLAEYLDGKTLTDDEMRRGLLTGIREAKFFPVLCGSAAKNVGTTRLLDSIIDYLPSPAELVFEGTDKAGEELQERSSSDPFSAFVFKTTTDPFVGRLNYIKVISGEMKPDSMLYNISQDKTERIGNVFCLRGKAQEPMKVVHAGDIAVVAKLQYTATGDTLCDKAAPIVYGNIEFPEPMYTMCIRAKNKGDEDKIGNALNRLMDEDGTFKVHKNTETKELLVSGTGELHLDIMGERLKRKFGVEVVLDKPKIPYRETIRSTVKIEGKHKKQSGGHGQYGDVWLQLDPLVDKDFEFVDSIFGGAVPRQYIPAVEKGVREAMQGGILAGYPMVGLRVTLYDGSYHTVDSSEMAFKIASTMALRKGALQADPILLEPVYDIEVTIPEGVMGDIIGDLNSKRGRIHGMEPIGGGLGVVKAQVPLAEIFNYAIDLRSITQGRGSFKMSFAQYEDVPQRIADSIIANAKADKADDH